MEQNEVVENQASPEQGQDSKADVQNASAPAQEDATKAPTTKGETEAQPEFDYRKSYEELRKEFTKRSQEWSSKTKKYDMTVSELAALKEAQMKMAETLAKATEKPVDPAEFIKDLQTQGPKALDNYIKKHLDAADQKYNKAIEQQATQLHALSCELEVERRRRDSANYPNFQDLEAKMQEVLESNECPVDLNQPVGVIYDALYNLVRTKHSEEAIKQAEQLGVKRAEAALAKESSTTVAGGGKAGTPPNLAAMSVDDLRKHFVSVLGEAE